MARPYSDLRNRIPVERRRRNEAETERLLSLQKLREALALSQEQLATSMQISQSSVSKIESRTDLYLSTLRRYVAALGGELMLSARFPEGMIEIELLDESGDEGEVE